MCDVRLSSRWLSLKEQFFFFKLAEEKVVSEHLQEVNLIITQLANLGILTPNEDLVDITLNNLPRSWSTFKQIQRGRERVLSFAELEGLLLQEELSRNLDKKCDELEEVNFVYTSRGPLRGGQHSSWGCSNYGRGFQHD